MKIPYGISNFSRIRREGYFYVDKTPFLPVLESAELMLMAFVSVSRVFYPLSEKEFSQGYWFRATQGA